MADKEKRKDDEDRGLKSKTVGDVVQDFWQSTGLQGLPRVFTSTSSSWKVFWFIMFLALVIGCAYQMWCIFDMYYSYDTTTSVSLSFAAAPLPSITLCSLNAVRRSQLLENAPTQLRNAFLQNNVSEFRTMYHRYRQSLTPDELSHLGHQKENLIPSAGILGQAGGSREGDMVAEFEFHEYATSVSPLYGACYTLNSADIQTEPIYIHQAGAYHGVLLKLYAESHEFVEKFLGRTFYVDIHAFGTMSHMEEVGLAIPCGFETFISIKQHLIQRLEPPYGDCSKDYAAEFTRKYNRVYTLESCNQTCVHRYIAEDCGCIANSSYKYYTIQQQRDLPACEYGDECVATTSGEVLLAKNKTCDCPLPCTETKYQTDLSMNPLEVTTSWSPFVNAVCSSEPNATHNPKSSCNHLKGIAEENRPRALRKNFAHLNIYYRDLNGDTYTEQIAYSKSQFLADFGGILGLWLGASIFTVLEIVELFVKIGVVSIRQAQCSVCERQREKRRNKRKQKRDAKNNGGANEPEADAIPLKGTSDV